MQPQGILLLVALLLAGCQALVSEPVAATPNDPLANHNPPTQWAEYRSRPVSFGLEVPQGWQSYSTEAGIVLNERPAAITDGITLEGILIHIFSPPLDSLNQAVSRGENSAWHILREVVSNPEYIGNAIVSEPVAFRWSDHDAAYYLLYNRDTTVTLLLALDAPETDKLVVCHVSAPEAQSSRIRELLPDILSSLTINDTHIGSAALHNLPDPLIFPTQTITSASR